MVVEKLQKVNTVLFFCFLVIVVLYYGSAFFIPLVFAIFLAALVVPVSNFLEKKWRLGRVTSSFISTLMIFLCIVLLLFFMVKQVGIFLTDLIGRKEEILDYVVFLQEKFTQSTGITVYAQKEFLRERMGFLFEILQNITATFFAGLSVTLVNFLLVLIYVLLLLINRDKFVEFIMMYVSEEKKEKTRMILYQTQQIAYKYLWGRLQVMLLLGIMYAVTFYSYGLPHANLLIVFGMIITIIPYIGPFLSGVFPILFMIIFGDGTAEIFSFIIIVIIIQLIESYVAEPLIIGSEVQQSPLFVIIAIILGGALWGIAGMILFVPIFAILKIIFDNNQSLKPVGFLIGYRRPGSGEDFFEKIKRKLKR